MLGLLLFLWASGCVACGCWYCVTIICGLVFLWLGLIYICCSGAGCLAVLFALGCWCCSLLVLQLLLFWLFCDYGLWYWLCGLWF